MLYSPHNDAYGPHHRANLTEKRMTITTLLKLLHVAAAIWLTAAFWAEISFSARLGSPPTCGSSYFAVGLDRKSNRGV
jgi:uncharacterized membrane protein